MKRLIIALIIILSALEGFSQPAGYVPGTWADWIYAGRHHGYYRAVGYTKAAGHRVVFFGGDGQDPANFATLDDAAPGSLFTAGGWNGITNLPGGGDVKWEVIVLGNSGTQPALYASDINFYFNNNGMVAGDTADHTKNHIAGLSGGPARAVDYMTNGGSHNDPYRFVFGTTIFMSCSAIFVDLTTQPAFTNRKHYVYYGNPAGDGNSGTPYSFSSILYSELPGVANVDRRFKVNPVGTHSDNTWGQVNNIASCLNTIGTDTATNRWLWMIYAFGSPGTNVPPVANAGNDQVVTLPTTFTTLNGTASVDADGTISTYAWTKISGPTGGTITSPAGSTTTITSLQVGVYAYKLVVTDNGGLNDDDTVQVTVTSGVASSNLLTINTSNYFWPWTAQEQPELLFDGLTDKKMDQDGFTTFSIPMIFTIELKDSVYDNLKVRFWNGFGQTQTWKVGFYDSLRVLKGQYQFDGAVLPFQNWYTLYGIPDTIQTPIRYVRFEVSNAQTDVREIEIYGDKIAKASTIIPVTTTPTVLTDPGRFHIGGSSLGGKDTVYMTLTSGKALYPAYRAPTNSFIWNHDQTKPYASQDIEMDKYGDMDKGGLRFHKKMGTEVMLYVNGSSYSSLYRTDLNPNDYNSMTALGNYKDILKGTDSTLVASWINPPRTYKALTAKWGRNTTPNLTGYNIFGTNSPDLTNGQNKVQVMEMENEADKTWLGLTGYHTPEVLWAKYRRIYDSIKNADPTMLAYSGAMLAVDTSKLKAIHFINFWKTGSKTNDPFDGICFNQYISSAYGGQPQGAGTSAVTPEQFQVKERMIAYGRLRDRIFPGKGFRWTELGFTPGPSGSSDYDVPEVPGIPDSVGVGAFMIRSMERAFMVPNVLERMYNYFHTSDGSGVFAGMKMVVELFDPGSFAYIGSRRLPIWFMYAMRDNALWDYKGYSTTVLDGDSTSMNIYLRDHVSDVTKKAYTIYLGSYSGATATNYVLNVGAATTATLITFQHNNETGIQTNLTVTSGTVTIPLVNEVPQYVIINTSVIAPPINKISKPNGIRWNIIQQ